MKILGEVFDRAADLCDDPLQSFLVGLKLLAEIFADLPGGHPGCMIASICYQERLFDRRVLELNRVAVESMNARFRRHLEAIAAVYPPAEPIDLDTLAEMASCVIDGGIIMSRVMADSNRLVQQILGYRALIKRHFSPAQELALQPPPNVTAVNLQARVVSG